MKKNILLIVCIVILVISYTGKIEYISAQENSSDYAIEFKVTYLREPEDGNPIYAGISINGYDFYKYAFEVGDVISYEVYLEDEIPGLGGMDVQMSKVAKVEDDGFEIHEWRMLRPTKEFPDQELVFDEDGVVFDQMNDLTSAAYKSWYERRVKVPEFFSEGFNVRHWAFKAAASHEMDFEFNGKTSVVYYKNVKVLDSEGNIKKIISGGNEKFIFGEPFDVNGIKIEARAVTDYPGAPTPTESLKDDSIESISNSINSDDNSGGGGLKYLIPLIAIGAIIVLAIALFAFIKFKRRNRK